MDDHEASERLAALGSVLRLKVFRFLLMQGRDGVPAGDIAAYFDLPRSTLSTHLAQLEEAGLITSWRVHRHIFYAADIAGAKAFMAYLGAGLCDIHPDLRDIWNHRHIPRRGDGQKRPRSSVTYLRRFKQGANAMEDRVFNVLFLCRHNSARSLMAEAILAREGQGRFNAYSAGSQPADAPHPYAVDILSSLNHPAAALRPKSWTAFATTDAPKMDFVFTVCDQTAGEVCPVWPGQPMTAHWPLPDPVSVDGTEAEKRFAFADTYRMLTNRISIFVNLPLKSLDALKLQERLDRIGRSGARDETKEIA